LDRLALDYFSATQRDDLAGRRTAAEAAARLSPGSNWSHNAGILALSQNRLREAVTYFSDVDPKHGWAQGWNVYWHSFATTYHLLGEFDKELDVAHRAAESHADPINIALHEIQGYIGGHHVKDATKRLDDVVREYRTRFGPAGLTSIVAVLSLAAREFHAHGLQSEATSTFSRAIQLSESPEAEAYVSTSPDTAAARVRLRRTLGILLYDAGRVDDASAVLGSLPQGDWGTQSYLALIAARRGDRATAERLMVPPANATVDPYGAAVRQARILTVLGDHDAAIRKLTYATNGYAMAFQMVHLYPDWDRLGADIAAKFNAAR
jgi:hypothetical protein